MKIYKGYRTPTGCNVVVINDGKTYSLPPRLDLKDHTPNGEFEFGYGGSGPSQLALALVADVTGDDALTLKIYQTFKHYVVVPLRSTKWTLTEAYLREFTCLDREIKE